MLYNFLVNFLFLIITVVVLFVVYMKWKFQHWKRNRVPYIEPSIPMGNLQSPLNTTKSISQLIGEYYEFARSCGYRHLGLFFFLKPTYMVIDPELVRLILAKDFHYFSDRNVYVNEEIDPISAHLFSLKTIKWKPLRAKLTPTFTSGRMKAMLGTVVDCGTQLKTAMDGLIGSSQPIDIKNVLGRFTTNVIGSCAFGLDCNCFEDSDSDFIKYAKKVFVSTPLQGIRELIGFSNPDFAKFLRLPAVSTDVSKFFRSVTKDTVEFREKNGVVRNDFLHLLIQLKNGKSLIDGKSDESNRITMDELSAQAFVFFLAGFETSSSVMTFCTYELALNQDIQVKLREEVNSVLQRHDGQITYEALNEMIYMGQVIDETLRKYPPLPVLNRQSVADYKIPNTDLVIEKDTMIFIPIYALQHDSEYFDDPERFDPERFSEENKHTIVPFTYLPFGDGPRNCIGLRFGLMQTKVGLTIMLKNYEFTLNNRTKTPLKMNPYSFLLSALGDIWLDVKKI